MKKMVMMVVVVIMMDHDDVSGANKMNITSFFTFLYNGLR